MKKDFVDYSSVLLQKIPSAMVVVDERLKVIEANEAFVKMWAIDMLDVFNSFDEGIQGASVERIFPSVDNLRQVLATGENIHLNRYCYNDNIYDLQIFSIEKNRKVGIQATDITKFEQPREEIAKQAREVIAKNITVVQNIAFLLGEHMVDTELLLSSIAESYDSDKES